MVELPPTQPESPKWGSTTKTVVGLAIAALFVGLLFYFRNIVAPLLLAFILAFLLHPIIAWIGRTINVGWRFAVNLVYLFLILILIATITVSGFAILQQAQSLIEFVDKFIQNLPDLVQDLSSTRYAIGPLQIDLGQLDLQSLTQQLLNIVQPIIGQAGNLLGRFAASAATTIGWSVFLLVISYFLLAEGGHLRENLVHIEIPGYNTDIRVLISKLAVTWDTFLRNQLLISLMVVICYYLILTILGTRLPLVIALMAGLARFVPYVGPAVTWTLTAIVAFLQPNNHFGLEPLYYTIIVIGACILLDLAFDNLVVPRFMGRALGVHPAGVLLAAIILARLIGLVGLVLAAPVLATLVLVGRYVGRKMFDLPPWPDDDLEPVPPIEPVWVRLQRLLAGLRSALSQRKSTK
jgi:predicted PurR-regulated permease PerM